MRTLPLALLALVACRGASDTDLHVLVDADDDGFDESEDCNDGDAAVYPDAPETCNGVDDDCSGLIDDDALDASTFFRDVDGDGHGDPTQATTACDPEPGWVADDSDCDDTDRDFYPGASEEDCADPADYNCDGSTGYQDADGDEFPACQDCDDGVAAVHPDATESCDGVDNDCDGQTDERGALGEGSWYADDDGDGYGDAQDSTIACDRPDGYVADRSDCNDGSAAAHPGAVEVCDDLDNDCDSKTDEADASDASTWYVDADRDGHGSADVEQEACDRPSGFTESRDDCDDGDATAHPGATEVCDDADNDCDGEVDEDTSKTWYIDYDGDGYGDARYTADECDRPAGYAENADDCDDLDEAVNPAAAESPYNGLDDDCDPGTPDDDLDDDGYGIEDDCDDDDPSVFPEPGGGCALGSSCADILEEGRSTGDGTYLIDPDGYDTGVAPFDAYCDMAGGGWTLCFAYDTSEYDGGNWPSIAASRNKFLAKKWGETDLFGEGATQGSFCSTMGVAPEETQLRAQIVKVADGTVLHEAEYTVADAAVFTRIHDADARELDCLVSNDGGSRLMIANYSQPSNSMYNAWALGTCAGEAGTHQTLEATGGRGHNWGIDGLLIMSSDPSGVDHANELTAHVNWYSYTASQTLYTRTGDVGFTKFGVAATWRTNAYGRSGETPGPNHCTSSCGYTNSVDNVFKHRIWIQ